MAELFSPLSNPDFLDRASAGDVLANALDTPEFVRMAAVASSEGNDLAREDTFVSDLKTMGYYDLDAKYGRRVADNRGKFTAEVLRQQIVRQAEPSIGDVAVDSGLAAASAVTGMIGGLSVAGVGILGAGLEATTGNTGVSELSADMGAVLQDATGFITSGMSDTELAKQELSDIEADLDQRDSTARMERRIAAGQSRTMANFERVGEDFLNFGERFYKDPYVAGNLISGALGSLWPSAKLAQAGVVLSEKLAARVGVTRGAATVGSAIGIGVAESSGTYVDTSSFVMGLSEEDMMNSPEYRALRASGQSHDQAQSVVAASTATEASARQLPTAAVLGLVAARFNTNPFKAFKGQNTVGYFREVGIQALEEGGQGITSTLNRNLAVRNQVDADIDVGAGLGESLGEGIFAGAGMAGVIGAPSLARSTVSAGVRGIADAVRSDTAATIASAVATGGADTLDAASALGARVAPVIEPIVSAAKVAAEKAREVTAPAVEAVKEFADRPNQKIQDATVAAAVRAVELSEGDETIGAISEVVTGLVETKVGKMTDAAILSASAAIGALKARVKDFSPELKAELVTILSSPDMIKIQKRMALIDLNKTQTAETEVSDQSVQETVAVARLNPVNVNPDHVKKILEQKDRTDLTEEDIKLLKAASEIASAVNNHQGEQVQISSEKSIALSKKPAYNGREAPEVTKIEDTSRSIQVGGFKDARGNKLRSVNDFAADIFEGAQSEDGTIVNDEGVSVPVASIVNQFKMFATHMANKVAALNQSAANADAKGTGTFEMFESLVGGVKMVAAGVAGGAKAVAYHINTPRSVAFAQGVHNDAVVAAEVYNTLVRTFPDLFPGGEITIPELTKTTQKQTPDTPAVEAVVEAAPDETKPQAEPEVVSKEEAASQTDEQPKKETPSKTLTEREFLIEELKKPTTEISRGEKKRIRARIAEIDAETTVVEETVSPEATTDDEADTAPVTQKFGETFTPIEEDVGYTSGQELLALLSVGTNTTEGYMSFAQSVFRTLIEGVNERLNTVLVSKKDGRTIGDAIRAGVDLTHIRDFKNTMLVDPETGQYDPDLVSIAAVAVIDWLSSVRSANPHQLSDTLENLGVTLTDLTNEEFDNIAYGVSPRQASEVLAKQIIRMWNVEANSDAQLVDARGAVEGLVKEMLTVLDVKFEFLDINDVPVIKDGKKVTTPTINVRKLQPIQKDIGLSGQNSVQKLLAPEENTTPSIGEKIEATDRTQSRGNVKLSRIERAALKAMQDTPHTKAKGISDLAKAIGFDVISKMLGFRDVSELTKNHPLRSSIEGKNLSIERDWDDAQAVLAELEGREDTPVYYPVGISKVGRHQFKGINPQNNKILRALVTPTHSTLDMTNQEDADAFWLTVAQASDLAKVENEAHQSILSRIQDDFTAKYGEAVELIEAYLTSGVLDADALFALTGELEMAQLNALFAVADFNHTTDKTKFETSLSFELDGKTDGPANMMSNFGQGKVTPEDMNNFQRVGFFLGTKFKTLNRFFSGGNVDLYQVTADRAQRRMFSEIAKAGPNEKKVLYAAARFAAIFGDFRITDRGTIEMTRNTAKNPMTKTVYGSGIRGVASGIAEEMVLEFYNRMVDVPEGTDPAAFLGYPDLIADFELLFGTRYPSNVNWKDSFIDGNSMGVFKDIIGDGIGEMVATTAKSVIGAPIIGVNDTLVFVTNVQTEFLQELFQKRLLELAEKRATEGKIERNKKGQPIIRQLSQSDYDALVAELKAYAPLYSNGTQTLAVGSFSGQVSDIELSSNMSGNMRMKSTLPAPDVAGVKIIPYVSIGRGDAMMMNTIYSSKDAPADTLPVFDGIDMPINKVKEYADRINGAVMQNWDRDVLGDIVADFENFLSMVGDDADILTTAFNQVAENSGKSSVTAKDVQELMETLQEQRRQNLARKKAFRSVPLSVDHMGGSDSAYTRGPDGEMTLAEINNLIENELLGRDITEPAAIPEGQPILETDTDTLLVSLLQETRNKGVRDTVRVLRDLLTENYKVVIGTIGQLESYRGEALPHSKGMVDLEAKVIYLTDNNHETLAHEMMHLATFEAVLAHYEGTNNDAVSRLETLMEQFMDMDFSDKGAALRNAANSAKAQILGYQIDATPFNQAAALNEFMAWTLTNEALIKGLKKETILTKLAKTVKALMRRILGKVPTNMFSNILFNTAIINDSPIDKGGDKGNGEDGGGNGDNNDNGNSGGGLTPSAHNFTNFWIDLVKARLEDLRSGTDRIARTDQFVRYQDAAKNAVIKLDFGGFVLSDYQKQTFKAIHMVLAMEMRLNTQSSIAMNKVFEYVTDNLTPEMFGPGKLGQELYATVRDLLGDTKNDESVTDAMAVLLALSQTSKKFREALDQLPEPETDNKLNAGTLNAFLTSITGMMMNKAIGTIDTSDGNAKELLDVLAENLLREDTDKEFSLLRDLMGSITRADNYVSGAMSKLAERAAEVDRRMQASDRSALTKILVGTVSGAAAFIDAQRSEVAVQGIKRLTHMGASLDHFVFFREFVTEIVGTDKTNAEVMQIQDRANYAIQAIRQDLKEDMPIIFQNAFENHPDADQWKAAHRILGKLDFANLFDLGNPERAFDLLTDSGLLSSKTAAKEVEINAAFSKAVADTILEKAKQLASFMNGKGAGHQLWKNAYAINRLGGEYDAKMTAAIDTLVSLYALEIADQAQKDTIAEMYDNDTEATKNLVTYMQALNIEEDLKIVSESARMNGYKGWVPDHGTTNARLIIEDDSKGDELIRMGFTRVGDYTAESKFSSVSRGYYTTTVKQGGSYSQGALQTVQGSYRGVNAHSGLTISGATSGVLSAEGSLEATKSLNDGTGVVNDKEVLIPVYDETGVIFYERAINPDVLEQYTKPRSNLALMLGAWAGRQVEEKLADQYNTELVIELKKIWDNRGPGDEGLFVDISNPKLKDQVYKDSWRVISPHTKAAIEDIFGEADGFPVRKDMVNLALGYRDPSIVDVWTGKTRMPKAAQIAVQAATKLLMGDRAVTILSRSEEAVQGVVSSAKDLIIVRSLIVPYMNMQANVFQLATRGVPYKTMIKGYRDKLAEIERFNVNKTKLLELDTRIALAGNNANRKSILQQQYQVILDENARMSIAPLIEAGAYKNISEGITDLDVELTSGRMAEWLEGQVNKLPPKLQTITKYAFISKDTTIYKAANKAVQYGDFLAKAIMYDHLLGQGMDADTAMKKINEEYVNFSVLPGRTRSYLESLGGTWFLSFKIRVMKIAMSILRDNPVRAMITAGTVGEFGSPVNDNLVTVHAQDRLDYALGWDMLFGAPSLNPWAQMSDWE